ncbi:hypothetical protein B0H13DRAFT_1932192 [Mycena leptocephala]|nr:hypothetical protein B0H13DRAFT_1932192 [Mycena leptocephala]
MTRVKTFSLFIALLAARSVVARPNFSRDIVDPGDGKGVFNPPRDIGDSNGGFNGPQAQGNQNAAATRGYIQYQYRLPISVSSPRFDGELSVRETAASSGSRRRRLVGPTRGYILRRIRGWKAK